MVALAAGAAGTAAAISTTLYMDLSAGYSLLAAVTCIASFCNVLLSHAAIIC
jgi:hypothetical protein